MSELLRGALVMRHLAEHLEAMLIGPVANFRTLAVDWQQFLLPSEPNEFANFADAIEQSHKKLVAQVDMICDRLREADEYLKANPDA